MNRLLEKAAVRSLFLVFFNFLKVTGIGMDRAKNQTAYPYLSKSPPKREYMREVRGHGGHNPNLLSLTVLEAGIDS